LITSWKKDSNLGYLEDKQLKSLFEDKTNGVDQANKRLAKANECLDKSIEDLKEARDFYLQLTQPVRRVADLYANDVERRTQKLMNTLEWREPTRLCESLGRDWLYQGASELVDTLEEHIVPHYNAWRDGLHYKQTNPLYLVLGGSGMVGKSRMLDEMKVLLCTTAEQSKTEDLMQRMRNAYVFHVTFENDSVLTGKLVNSKVPEFDISYQMLYQLSKDRPEKDWNTFSMELNTMYLNWPLTIGEVLRMLEKLEKIDDKENMMVILCLGGLQKLQNNGTKTCALYKIYHTFTALCSFFISSIAFVICVCSTTAGMLFEGALQALHQNVCFCFHLH